MFNHAKLRIFYSIDYLEETRVQATANNLLTMLPDYDGVALRVRLLHYYIRGYLKRAAVPKKKTTTKKTMWGWSTRDSFKYKLNDKGKRCLGNLLFRYSQGLDLNLHRRNPQKVNYFKHWTKEDLEKSKISTDELERLGIDLSSIGGMEEEDAVSEEIYRDYDSTEGDTAPGP